MCMNKFDCYAWLITTAQPVFIDVCHHGHVGRATISLGLPEAGEAFQVSQCNIDLYA